MDKTENNENADASRSPVFQSFSESLSGLDRTRDLNKIGDDKINQLARELLMQQMQKPSWSADSLPRLSIQDKEKQKSEIPETRKTENEEPFSFQIGKMQFEFDRNSLASNQTKFLGTGLLYQGMGAGIGIGGLGASLMMTDTKDFDKKPAIATLSMAADGAMIYSGTMQMWGHSGPLISGLGQLGFGSRLAIGDAQRLLNGDRSLKNSLALGTDLALLSSGILKMASYGPRWVQGGLMIGALFGRAIVPLLPDRIRSKE